MTTVYAAIVLILKAPFMLLGYLAKNPKLLIVLVIAGFAAGVYFNFVKQDDALQVNIPEYQKIAPSIQDAPIVFATTSRIYYVETMSEDDKYYWLEEFYSYDADTWQINTVPLPIDKTRPARIYER